MHIDREGGVDPLSVNKVLEPVEVERLILNLKPGNEKQKARMAKSFFHTVNPIALFLHSSQYKCTTFLRLFLF